MPWEKMNQEFRMQKIDKIRNYSIEEINRNELMSKKHKNVCRFLNYIDYRLIAISQLLQLLDVFPFLLLLL